MPSHVPFGGNKPTRDVWFDAATAWALAIIWAIVRSLVATVLVRTALRRVRGVDLSRLQAIGYIPAAARGENGDDEGL